MDRREAGPTGWIFQHHRAAVVDDAVFEDRQIAAFAQILVDLIAAGVHGAAEKHDIAGLEFAHVGFAERRVQRNRFLTACSEVEQFSFLAVIALELAGRLIQPFHYVPLGVKDDAAPAIGPAHVGDADEKRRRQTIARSDLAAADRQLAAESHRADVELVGLIENPCFQGRQLRYGIGVVQFAEKLLLGELVARRAIAADADAEEARATALALGVPHRIEDAGAHAVEIAVAALAAQCGRQRILSAHVLAATALEDKADVNSVLTVLMPVKDRTAGAEVVAGVLATDAV